MIDSLIAAFFAVHQWLFESVVQPVVFKLGMGNLLEEAYAGVEWFLMGVLDIVILLLLIRPLEKWRPIEKVTDRRAVNMDVIYTLIHRLALFRLALFFTTKPLMDGLKEMLHGVGVQPIQLENLWPGVTDIALLSFLIYLVVLDFVEYWLHRAQHQFNWWWALHSLHHSQRQLTMWSDNRNHLLDDVIIDLVLVLVATFIGVPPEQFILLTVASRVMQSLQHANVRLSFNGFAGGMFERLIISPRFHRMHHAIGIGHESHGPQTLGGHNFGVLLPWWDMMFRTANFDERYDATGVRDQVEQGRDYGSSFWQQQWLGLKRIIGRA